MVGGISTHHLRRDDDASRSCPTTARDTFISHPWRTLTIRSRSSTWTMVKRSENGDFGIRWLRGHGLSVASEAPCASSRVGGAASSLQIQSQEPQVASGGVTTAAL